MTDNLRKSENTIVYVFYSVSKNMQTDLTHLKNGIKTNNDIKLLFL